MSVLNSLRLPFTGRPTTSPEHSIKRIWTSAAGYELHCRVWCSGKRPSVVLVHGYGVSSSYFEPIAEHLAAEFDVYAPDLPGHGLTEKADHVLSVTELADVLQSWMRSAGVFPAILIGNSMGCQIIAHLTVRHPELVDRLIFIGPTPDPSTRRLYALLPRFAIGGAFERPALNVVLARDYYRAGATLLLQELSHMLGDK